MRIDFHSGPHTVPESNQASAKSRADAVNLSQPGEDHAQLSGAHVQVTALAAHAAQLPEVREERVQALREAVHSGHYRTNAEKVAGALFEHMVFGPAA